MASTGAVNERVSISKLINNDELNTLYNIHHLQLQDQYWLETQGDSRPNDGSMNKQQNVKYQPELQSSGYSQQLRVDKSNVTVVPAQYPSSSSMYVSNVICTWCTFAQFYTFDYS